MRCAAKTIPIAGVDIHMVLKRVHPGLHTWFYLGQAADVFKPYETGGKSSQFGLHLGL